MKKAFFKPFIGDKYYTDGILGKKILVVGASFYCHQTECKFYKQCTDETAKDSSRFDSVCPEYKKTEHLLLSDSPSYELEYGTTYVRFGIAMSNLFCESKLTWKEVWDRCAFTNYIQFILPHWQTHMHDISDRDLEAFIEVVSECKPNIIIVWGVIIDKPIKTLATDLEQLEKSEGYLFSINVDNRIIPVVNSYHPASSAFFYEEDIRKFQISLLKASLEHIQD